MANIVVIKSKKSEHTLRMDTKGTAKRNAYANSEQSVFLRKNPINDRFLTGYELPQPKEEILKDRKHPYYTIALERDLIEKQLNVDFSNPDDEKLINYRMILCDRSGTEVTLKLDNVEDKFKYNALIAGAYVAENEEALNEVKFLNCLYYFARPSEDIKVRKEVGKLRNRLIGILNTNEDNKLWLIGVAHKLDLKYSTQFTEDNLYDLINEFILGLKNKTEILKVYSIFDLSNENIIYDFVVKKAAARYYLIKSATGDYVINDVPVGKNEAEYLMNLKLPSYSEQFNYIRNKIFKDYKLV